MGERHHVPNLTRRGNSWHWRARVPSTFRECSDKRLSLSFGGCDHRTAASLALHLNRRLHQLRHEPSARMTTRDQLAKLMEAERDAEMERLDNAVSVRRRYGKGHDLEDVREDLIHAWAYRLLQHWGVAGRLSFDGNCPGRALLADNGVRPDYVPAIAEAFLSIQDGLAAPAFDNRMRERLSAFGIEDTLANRERGKAAVFEARSQALFDYKARYPHIRHDDPWKDDAPSVGRRLHERSTTLERLHDEYAEQDELLPPNHGHSRVAYHDQVAGEAFPPSHAFEPLHQPPQTAALGHVNAAKPDDIDGQPSVIDLPVSDMLQVFEILVANKGEEWTKASANDARRAVKILVGILQEHAVSHSGQIRQFHLGELRSHFNRIPTNYGKSSRLSKMSTLELRSYAQLVLAEAKRTGDKEPAIGLQAATIRKHFANIDSFFTHLRGNGYAIFDWTFRGIRPPKKKTGEIRHQTDKPSPTQMRPIFDAPIFVGCANWEHRGRPGFQVFHDSLYYVPMLFAYLGARRAELTGLAVKDVYEHDEWGWILHIRPNDLRRIKNVQSDRILPIPDELIRLNFLEYRQKLADLGETRLFPELFSHLTENDPGDRFYDDFIPIMKKVLGDAMWERSLHALRHGFANTLKQAGVDTVITDDISGRLSAGETGLRYTAAAEVPLMRIAMTKMPIITGHLAPKPIQLLPWVERGENPPWARPGRKNLAET